MRLRYSAVIFALVFLLLSSPSVYPIDITGCNTTWKEDSNVVYDLVNDVQDSSDTLCLRFRNAENITLDCHNHWLNGTNNYILDYGIYAQYVDNINIVNCRLDGWKIGFYFYYVNYSNISSISLFNINDSFGLEFSDHNNIKDVTIDQGSNSILIKTLSNNNTFENITITSSIDNHTGIQFDKSNNNIFHDIYINSTGAQSNGVVFSNSSDNIFYDSTFDNTDYDVYSWITNDDGFSNNAFVNTSLNVSKIFFQNDGFMTYITSHVDVIHYLTVNFTGYNLLDVNYSLVSTDVLVRNNITENNIDSSLSYVHNYTYATVFFNGINYANNFSIDASAINFSDYSGTKTLDKNDYITINLKLINGQECNYSNDNCYSTYCKEDYDSTGSWCALNNQCMHNSLTYSSGAYSPDCYNTTGRAECMSGNWNHNNCNQYQCDSGACYINCTNTTTYCQNPYSCIDNGINGVCSSCNSYNNRHCSVSSNDYLSDGFCAFDTVTWSCDNSYIALATNGNYYNQCYASIQGANCDAGSIAGAYSAAGLCVNSEECVQGIISSDEGGHYYENCSASSTSLIYTCMDYINEDNFTATGICAHNNTDYECVINTAIYNNSNHIYQGCSNGEGQACTQNQTTITSVFTPDGICTLNNVCTGFQSEVSYNGTYIEGCIDNNTQCDSNLTSTVFEPDGLCFMYGCLVNGEQTLNEVCVDTSSCIAGINLTCHQYLCKGDIGFSSCSDNTDCAGDLKCHENVCEANTL